MTERKFTPPTTFPADYVTRDGNKAVIVGPMPNDNYPYLGYVMEGEVAYENSWTSHGKAYEWSDDIIHEDLFDIVPEPQNQVRWANDYEENPGYFWVGCRKDADLSARDDRIAVIRREWVEGQPPQYFTEEV